MIKKNMPNNLYTMKNECLEDTTKLNWILSLNAKQDSTQQNSGRFLHQKLTSNIVPRMI